MKTDKISQIAREHFSRNQMQERKNYDLPAHPAFNRCRSCGALIALEEHSCKNCAGSAIYSGNTCNQSAINWGTWLPLAPAHSVQVPEIVDPEPLFLPLFPPKKNESAA